MQHGRCRSNTSALRVISNALPNCASVVEHPCGAVSAQIECDASVWPIQSIQRTLGGHRTALVAIPARVASTTMPESSGDCGSGQRVESRESAAVGTMRGPEATGDCVAAPDSPLAVRGSSSLENAAGDTIAPAACCTVRRECHMEPSNRFDLMGVALV